MKGLARQYYRYGYYRARTFRRHPQSMRRSHLIAPALVLALLAALLAPRPLRALARLALLAYLLAVAGTGASVASRPERRAEGGLLLAVLPAMHFGWGFGTLAGMLRFGPPVSAFANLVRGTTPPEDGEAADGVYAPSLNGEDA